MELLASHPLPLNQSLPAQLRAGDQHTWSVQTSLDPGTFVFFVLTAIVGNTPVRYFIARPDTTPSNPAVAVDTNGIASYSLASSVTAGWQPARYQWVAFAQFAGGNRQQLAQGEMRILPDPAGLNPIDPRSDNQKLLAAIRCLLQGKALDDAIMYKIGERELTRMPIKELLFWEGVVEGRVKRERRRAGEKVPSSTIGIVFGGR